ncbi:SpoIID/LytB domain-containing protein [Brassicibacter mesophilus]|uniref:SpoIID/LytB domain-containing protein n=1 Tax=Brassicibacter mesophilus TaxID=745119 RepID=UPI003D2284E0
MKIKINSITLFCIIVITLLYTPFAYGEKNDTEYIKIGLKGTHNSNNIIALNSDGFEIGVFNDIYRKLFTINDNTILARPDNLYNVQGGEYKKVNDILAAQIGPFHIEVDMDFSNYEELSYKVDSLRKNSISAYPAYVDGELRLWIGNYINADSARNNSHNLTNIVGESLNIIEGSMERVVLEDNNGQVLLIFDLADNIVLRGQDNGNTPLIKAGKYKYRDYITFSKAQNEFIAVNYVELDNYLYGVVPREMSANWPIEALKAQAVAARNYSLLNTNKHVNSGYDLCDTQDCQVYGGYDWENIRSNTAVDETSGNVLKYDGKLVNTFYHSSSGGHTENSENVWSESIPYLRGVKDEFSLGSPDAKWELVITKEELSKKLLDNGIDVGEVLSIDILEVSEYGRVVELMISGSNKNEILKKEKSRLVLGPLALKSTWFNVKSDSDVYILDGNDRVPYKTSMMNNSILSSEGKISISKNSKTKLLVSDGTNLQILNTMPTQYVFNGKGWGHGLGMSQWGAKGMAELGYNYKEILEYYYTGAIVE